MLDTGASIVLSEGYFNVEIRVERVDVGCAEGAKLEAFEAIESDILQPPKITCLQYEHVYCLLPLCALESIFQQKYLRVLSLSYFTQTHQVALENLGDALNTSGKRKRSRGRRLGTLPNLEDLSLEDATIRRESFTNLLESLKSNVMVTRLSLDYVAIEERYQSLAEFWEPIFALLRSNTNL